jgi:putative hydrolase of the HAD superfamily
MQISNVIFDLDDTLMYEERSDMETYGAVADALASRYHIGPESFAATIANGARTLWRAQCPVRSYCLDIGISSSEALAGDFSGDDRNLGALRSWVPVFRRQAWLNALRSHGLDGEELADELSLMFIEERKKRHIVFDETQDVLLRLSRNYRLALLTNGAPEIQREKLEKSGLSSHFDIAVISGEVGAGKPRPEVYLHCLDRLGASSNCCVMVGDNLRNDIKGAQNVGMKGIWVNRNGVLPEEGIYPDAEMKSLDELFSALVDL